MILDVIAWTLLVEVHFVLMAAVCNVFGRVVSETGYSLMVGGNIAGETRTLSIALYDRVQAFDLGAAHTMALVLVGLSLAALALVFAADRRPGAVPVR